MKKLLSIIMVLGLVACNSGSTNTSSATSTPTSAIANDIETDVLVVGGGFAGITAAIQAAENGANVVLLEKNSFLGGAGLISSGASDACGSEFEKEKGIEDSTESLKEDILAAGNGYNVEWMVDTFVENIGSTFDWLVSIGVEYTDPTPSEEHSANRVFLATDKGQGINSALTAELEKQDNVTVMMNTKATNLIVDDNGSVVGANVENKEGSFDINAKSVILATGGYGANKELLTDTLAKAPYYGFAGSTGDGHIMAENVGAELVHMDFGKLYPAGWQYEEGKAKIQTGYDNFAFATTSAICVTSEGKRAFREGGYNKDFKTAILNDPNGLVYMLLDDTSYQTWKEKVLTNTMGAMTTEEELASFIEADGTASEAIYQADTIEELAEKANMNATVLQETIDRYNSFVDSGVDEDFGRTTLTAKITDGPYTLVAQYLRFATTLGGVNINQDYQVLKADGSAISGLYAAGEIVYGLHGNDTIQGSPIGWALISGKAAGNSVTK